MHKKQVIVLDSNEIIFGLLGRNNFCRILIDNLYKFKEFYDFKINGQIFSEVSRNIPKDAERKFIALLRLNIIKFDKDIIDASLIEKYKKLCLKKGDIIIAAYADKIEADCIISENRHFLKELKTKQFKIRNAEDFIKDNISYSKGA